MVRTLLVPLDGSRLGEAALPWAACLARARGLPIALARVVPWPSYAVAPPMGAGLTPELYNELLVGDQRAAALYLDGLRDRLAGEGLPVRTAVRTGIAVENILELADERGAAAIAMSTHGRGGLGRLILGSVAEQLLHLATIPILLVRARLDQPTRPVAFNRVLVPVDGSTFAERALDEAVGLLTDRSTLVLLQVVPTLETTLHLGEVMAPLPDSDEALAAIARAEGYLAYLRDHLPGARGRVETRVRVGTPADEITAAGDEERADLIVVASHGRTAPARWWLGSVADAVVRHARTPVYLVSARALAADEARDGRPPRSEVLEVMGG